MRLTSTAFSVSMSTWRGAGANWGSGATRRTLHRPRALKMVMYIQPMSNSQGRTENLADDGKAWWLLCSSSPPMKKAMGYRLVAASSDSKLR